MARRKARCAICQKVTAIEDVNARLFDEAGTRRVGFLRLADEYLRSCGFDFSRKAIANHAKHVGKDLEDPPDLVHPGKVMDLTPANAPASWFDLQGQAMDVSMDAMRSLRARMADGDLSPREEISLTALGLRAADKRADMEMKGRQFTQTVEALRLISSGHSTKVALKVGSVHIQGELGEGAAGVERR